MKAVSLFSGAGGMDVGFSRSGFEILLANEMNSHAAQTFRANHPDTQMIEGDINGIFTALEAYRFKIDVLFGGPPCQGFSVAGKMSQDDPRSQLVFSFCRAVETIYPKIFVMENVKALGVLDKFDSIRRAILTRFEKAGYHVSMSVLNACDYGVPQNRERLFFIGVRQDIGSIFDASILRKYMKKGKTVRETILPLGHPSGMTNHGLCKAVITPAKNPVLRKSPYSGMLFNGKGRPIDVEGYCNTLTASMGGNRTPIIDEMQLYHGRKAWIEGYHEHLMSGGEPIRKEQIPPYLRRLTVLEAAAIQTFPDDYIWCGSQSAVFTQIGNAVPPNLAESIAMAVKELLQERLIYDIFVD